MYDDGDATSTEDHTLWEHHEQNTFVNWPWSKVFPQLFPSTRSSAILYFSWYAQGPWGGCISPPTSVHKVSISPSSPEMTLEAMNEGVRWIFYHPLVLSYISTMGRQWISVPPGTVSGLCYHEALTQSDNRVHINTADSQQQIVRNLTTEQWYYQFSFVEQGI